MSLKSSAFLCVAVFLTSPLVLTKFTAAYVMQTPNSLSPLASKVIFESPQMDNTYKEFLVTSKPLTLRKYGKHGPGNTKKTKKNKKDSRIFFIRMPPMPYRYLQGYGYDYQPVKINPIMLELPTINENIETQNPSKYRGGYNTLVTQQQHTQQPTKNPFISSASEIQQQSAEDLTTSASSKESKIVRMDFGKNYFNGRPMRLQVAHARPKDHLTPHNLKSKLYFNKTFIY